MRLGYKIGFGHNSDMGCQPFLPHTDMTHTPLHTATPTAVQPTLSWLQPEAAVIVLTTAPDALLAKRLAHELVEEHLAACAHVGAAVVAMYMWQGKLEGGDEVPITFKTSVRRAQALMDRIRQMHPYQVPEILVLPVMGGDSDYLAWVQEQTSVPAV